MVFGKFDEAIAQAERAFEIGKRFGDADLQALALVVQGSSLVYLGELDAGLALLDEASTSALTGELDPFSATRRLLHDDHRRPGRRRLRARPPVDRGREPVVRRRADARLPRRLPRAPFARSSGSAASGRRPSARPSTRAPSSRPTTCSRRRPATTRSARSAGGAATSPPPRRPTGRRTSSDGSLNPARLCSGSPRARPRKRWRDFHRSLGDDGKDPLSRARRLPAQVEVSLAVGDVEAAKAAAAELEELTDRFRVGGERTPLLDGALQLSLARIATAEEDWDAAEAAARGRSRSGHGSAPRTRRPRRASRSAWRTSARETEPAPAPNTRLRRRRSSDSAPSSTRSGRWSCSARRPPRIARSSSPTSSTRRSCSRRSGRRSGRSCSTATTRCSRKPSAHQRGEVIKHTGDGFFAAFDDPGVRRRSCGADPARARGRDLRGAHRHPQRRGARARQRLHRARRQRRGAHRCARRRRRDPRLHRDARRHEQPVRALRSRARPSSRASQRPCRSPRSTTAGA